MGNIQSGLLRESFIFACRICEQYDPEITHDLVDNFQKAMSNLLQLQAFTPISRNWSQDQDSNYVSIEYINNKPGYFKEDKWIKITSEDICSYRLNFNWILKIISLNLNLSYKPLSIIDDHFWQLGTISKTHIFFARRIYDRQVFDKISEALEKRSGIKAVILTSSNTSHRFTNHKIIFFNHCLVHSEYFTIDKDIINNAVSPVQTGFSEGYRSACFNGINYVFTKKQAAVMEVLHKQGKLHKHELMVSANSDQDDPRGLFRNKGKHHPAWNVLIKNDGRGNYWLEY